MGFAHPDFKGNDALASTGSIVKTPPGSSPYIIPADQCGFADTGSKAELFLRKTVVASPDATAETKIRYGLLDNALGKPGRLEQANTPTGMKVIANAIGKAFGSSARAYWMERYVDRMGTPAGDRRVDRLFASLRKASLLCAKKNFRSPAEYTLMHPGGADNEVHSCPAEWLRLCLAGQISATELLILMVLRSFNGPAGIIPSQETLGKAIGSSEATVQKALASLLKKGHISAQLKEGRRHNTYVLLLPDRSSSSQNDARVKTTPSTSLIAVKTTESRCYNQLLVNQKQEGERGRKSTGNMAPRPAVSPAPSTPSPEKPDEHWRSELRPIEDAMRPHAAAIGKAQMLGADQRLASMFWQVTGGNLNVIRSAAAKISKEILRRFAPTSPTLRRKPWPRKLGYWISVLEEESVFDQTRPVRTESEWRSPPLPDRYSAPWERTSDEPGPGGLRSARDILSSLGAFPGGERPNGEGRPRDGW